MDTAATAWLLIQNDDAQPGAGDPDCTSDQAALDTSTSKLVRIASTRRWPFRTQPLLWLSNEPA
jgi:hypothetical protein